MENRTTVSFVLSLVLILASVFVIMLMILPRVDRMIKNKAIDDCAKIARYEKTLTEDNAKVSYPLVEVYNQCLKDKGYVNSKK